MEAESIKKLREKVIIKDNQIILYNTTAHQSPFGNCQLFSISHTECLQTSEEFYYFLSFCSLSFDKPACIIDITMSVYNDYIEKWLKLYDKDFEVISTMPYISTNESSMIIILLDLGKILDKHYNILHSN